MKSTAALLLTFFTLTLQAQDYDHISKIDRHVSIVYKNDFCGIIRDKKLVLPLEYHSIDQGGYGGFYLYQDSLAGFADESGNILIAPNYQLVEEMGQELLLVQDFEFQHGIIDRAGKVILPLSKQQVDYHELVIHITRPNGEQAIYDNKGNVVVPFDVHELMLFDDYGDYINIRKGEDNYVLLKDHFRPIDGYEKVNERLMVKKTEVSIKEYMSAVCDQRVNYFLYDAEGSDYLDYLDLLPDTNRVEKKFLPLYRRFFEALKIEEPTDRYEVKLKNAKGTYSVYLPFIPSKEEELLMDFPVTGVSLEQATYFTKWLNLLFTEFLYTYDEVNVRFRLPSEKEWVAVAESGLNENMRVNHVLDSINNKNCMLFIYSNMPACEGYEKYFKASRGGGSISVKFMNPDYKGILQFFGNVAELTSEKGIAKGGSYFHPAAHAKTSEKQIYSNPEPWLGFRVVAEYCVD